MRKCCVGQRSMVINSVTMAQATGRVLFPPSLPDLLFQDQDVSVPASPTCVCGPQGSAWPHCALWKQDVYLGLTGPTQEQKSQKTLTVS